jgi:hypothetical protein
MKARISASTCPGGDAERACALTYSPTMLERLALTMCSSRGSTRALVTHIAQISATIRIAPITS